VIVTALFDTVYVKSPYVGIAVVVVDHPIDVVVPVNIDVVVPVNIDVVVLSAIVVVCANVVVAGNIDVVVLSAIVVVCANELDEDINKLIKDRINNDLLSCIQPPLTKMTNFHLINAIRPWAFKATRNFLL